MLVAADSEGEGVAVVVEVEVPYVLAN